MRVRNDMAAPFEGRGVILPGQSGEVDPARPGVQKMICLLYTSPSPRDA